MDTRPAEGGPVAPEGTDALVVAHIPAAAAFIRLARLLVGCFIETHLIVGDVQAQGARLAVTEVFTSAVEAHRHAAVEAPVVLRLAMCERGATISLEDRAGPARPTHQDGSGLVLARALVSDAWVEPTGGGSVVHLLVAGPRAGGRR